MFAIVRTSLYQRRWSLLAWVLGAMTMVWLTLIFYPSFTKDDSLNQLVQSMPQQLRGLVGNANNFKTIDGYLDTVVFNLRVPMVVVTMAIIYGINLTSGSEDRGTLSTLLAQSVSRGRILAEKFLALVLSILVVHVGVFAGIWAALFTIHDSFSVSRSVAITFTSFMLAVSCGALAFGLGALSGKKGLSSGLATVIVFGSYLINSLAPSVASLNGAQKFTLFYYYTQPSAATNGIDWSYTAVLALVAAVFVFVGWAMFRHRDVEV
jgi:ABC-2 type transport system permease protein